tara:strand:+ start:6106 stop:7143 length:1038 start_codon:yes stop_codon:yes gene_type:complete
MISIVGAGHAGCYAAELLAKQSQNVTIYEKNKVVGSPFQCTGILTSDIDNIIKLPKKLLHTSIESIRINAPNQQILKVKFSQPNYVLKRTQFVQYMADRAVKAGAKLKTSTKWTPSTQKNSSTLIGADGPYSTVARTKKFQTLALFEAPQVLVNHNNDNIIDTYPGIGEFSWVCPVTKDTSLVGLLAYKNSTKLLQQFLEQLSIKRSDILERNGGMVPIFNPYIKTQHNNTYLLGDAAGQVKATTAGGIIQGMIAAQQLAKCIEKGSNYDLAWRKKLFLDLFLHLRVHKTLHNFKPADWNKLIVLFKQNELRTLLEQNNREKISKFIYKVPYYEPSVLEYLKYLR